MILLPAPLYHNQVIFSVEGIALFLTFVNLFGPHLQLYY